jgi:hypothetical protein
MPTIYVDFTGDETAWSGGDIHVVMLDHDTLRGNDPAIAIGEHELIFTIPQAITFFDLLDGWLNGGPITEVGGIERRIHEALKDAAEDFTPAIRGAITRSADQLAKTLHAYLRLKGLRFRLAGEDPEENPSLARRYARFRERQRVTIERARQGGADA